jgi:hypothetical protein
MSATLTYGLNSTLQFNGRGTYTVTDTEWPVTFSGSGSFTSGANTFMLTASGIPTEVKDSTTNTYTLNPLYEIFGLTTSPNSVRQIQTFGRHIYQTETGIFSTLTAGAYAGSPMTVGNLITTGTNRAQRIVANVTTVGTYNISATNNGVTFSRAGTFGSPGNNGILLIPSGRPIASGTFTFTTNTNPSVSFNITF